MKDLVILKLGGSIVTDKNTDFKANPDIIRNVGSIIKQYEDKYSFILVHGGGSFGHPVAKKYKVHEGLKESNMEGLVETRKAMQRLNYIVIDELSKEKLPVVAIQPSAIFTLEKGGYNYNIIPLMAFLKSGFIPVLYGDAIYDSKKVFSILSGDTIIQCLSKELKPKLIIFGCDVDGVYSDDPKTNKNAQLASEIDPNFDFSKFTFDKNKDVTGGIVKKIQEMIKIAKNGAESWIINLKKNENLKKLLENKTPYGTKIKGDS